MTMLLIGNQIRFSRSALASAMRQRFDLLFKTLARRQVEAGANWLLIDLGPQRRNAGSDLAWLVETIQDEVIMPLVLRGDDPTALAHGIRVAEAQVLIDATLPGAGDPEPYLELAERYDSALALSACPDALPLPTEERLAQVTDVLLPKAFDAGRELDEVYVDPLTTALTCDQPMVPVAVETLRLLKVAADPAPNTIIHLDDVADGAAVSAKPYILQAYLAMVLAAGVDALVVNPLDPDLMDVLRVITERDPTTDYDRLLLRLYDVTKTEAEIDPAFINESDPEQINLYRTVQVLNNDLLYADGYLRG
jgi:5-methyltetrahydrofolate--homocysteine methyltransferase